MFYDNLFKYDDFLIPGSSINDIDILYDPKTGFLKGNMFKSLYKPYKNYNFKKLNPSNKREELLFKIMMYSFALNDLNLYLDIHQDDKDIFNIFKSYSEKLNMLTKEYVDKYNALTVCDITNDYNYPNDFPWEVKDV